MLNMLALQPAEHDEVALRVGGWLGRVRQQRGQIECVPTATETTLGYGSCQVSTCPCGKYTGAGWECQSYRCGHKFSDHN